jgi:hypothetical protein
MGSLSGTILNTVGGLLSHGRVTLVPIDDAVSSGGAVRVGGTTLTLGTDGSFTASDVPDGDYQVAVRFYDPAKGEKVTVHTPTFTIDGVTVLADALGLLLLSGPLVNVIGLDTDGRPYYEDAGGQTYSVFKDTDGVPYYATGAGGENVYSDTDGAPVVLTL